MAIADNPIVKKVANEPLLIVAALIAGLSTVEDPSWPQYGVAAVVALLRFVVTGPVTSANLQAQIQDQAALIDNEIAPQDTQDPTTQDPVSLVVPEEAAPLEAATPPQEEAPNEPPSGSTSGPPRGSGRRGSSRKRRRRS